MKEILSHSLVAESPTMRSVFEIVDTIAATDMTALLVGETGVGKEVMAEYIHRTSPRTNKPLIKVGMAALPHELLESELFGHEKGAFTGAFNGRKGLFELADTGSIFLDDIDDCPLDMQVKLLRVLEAQELMRIGGSATIPIDVRVICATKVNLKELSEKGMFRADLYYRIHVVPIVIPPLRERKIDIPVLMEHFLQRYSSVRSVTVSGEAMTLLMNYSWPGNVRELRNVCQQVGLFAKDNIVKVSDLPMEIRDANPVHAIFKTCSRCFSEGNLSLEQLLSCVEINMLERALKEHHGNKSHAARSLRLNLSTFRDKLKKYQLDEFRE